MIPEEIIEQAERALLDATDDLPDDAHVGVAAALEAVLPALREWVLETELERVRLLCRGCREPRWSHHMPGCAMAPLGGSLVEGAHCEPAFVLRQDTETLSAPDDIVTEMRKWGWEPTDDFWQKFHTDALVHSAFNALTVQGGQLAEKDAEIARLTAEQEAEGVQYAEVYEGYEAETHLLARKRDEALALAANTQRQLDAVDEALVEWEPHPDDATGCVGRVQTIQNLRADRALAQRYREALEPASVAEAMQAAWNDFRADTGNYPDCFEWRGRKLYADFTRGNFSMMVAECLRRALLVEHNEP